MGSGGTNALDDALDALRSAMAAERQPVAETAARLRTLADAIEALGAVPSCRIAPFIPGRRPNIEAHHPGLGSSDSVAVLTGGDDAANEAVLLFDVSSGDPRLTVEATMSWADSGDVVAGWDRRPVDLGPVREGQMRPLVIRPESTFDPADLGFAHAYLRRADVRLSACWDGTPVASSTAALDVCDIRNLGSLYVRVLDEVVAPDAARQAAAWNGTPVPGPIHHPWSPVLIIGTDKAMLYTKAIVSDIVDKTDHLSDPAWLLRVGVYLELLTCIGIFEAVRDELGDLLTPEERRIYETDPAWAEVRARINVEGWKSVWDMRKISPPRLGVPRAGAVSALNLLQKKRATLAFLHVHHEDLKHAIDLAGVNLHNSQETWQRVFRDAERAVLRKTGEVFPELDYLPGPMREVAMWQQTGVVGQQGVYPTACTQYRASMNYVAAWAKQQGLMDYTGEECVPLRVSLLDAMMNEPSRVEVLQRGDGYLDLVDTRVPSARTAGGGDAERMLAHFESLLANVPILTMLSPDELRSLAEGALPLMTMPGERIVVQGAEGDSLFVVADGEVEVMLRQDDGRDRAVDTMGDGAVFGEMALLTGERRNATVRAVDTAMILEIGPRHYEPILRAHPEWLDQLAEMMSDRLRARQERLAKGEPKAKKREKQKSTKNIRDQIYGRFFAAG